MDMSKSANQYKALAAVVVFVLGSGALFYHWVEGLSWLDAIYFCFISLTTIGYGDIAPQTDLGKVFTIFYVLMGSGIIASLISIAAQRRARRAHERQQQRERERKTTQKKLK